MKETLTENVETIVIAEPTEKVSDFIEISQEMVNKFKEFLKNKEDFLETGLGAFHTDNHSNW